MLVILFLFVVQQTPMKHNTRNKFSSWWKNHYHYRVVYFKNLVIFVLFEFVNMIKGFCHDEIIKIEIVQFEFEDNNNG